MYKPFLFKSISMALLITLMAIAVSYVNDIIIERQQYQEYVKKEIASSSAHAQTIFGPVLAVPYTEEYVTYVEEVAPSGAKLQKPVTKRWASIAYFLPENVQMKGAFANEYKSLGIYKALMYQLGGEIRGDFRLPAKFDIKAKHKGGTIALQAAYIGFGISDPRGISGAPVLRFANKEYKFKQGSHINSLGNGIHAILGDIEADSEQVLSFSFDLNLLGMERFRFIPIAENNLINLKSSWQHPHFGGSFLPLRKSIGDNGFVGEWSISSLSSNNQSSLINSLKEGEGVKHPLERLSVGFVDPINVYSQSDRATKYGLLFIGLTFAGFFLFEILKKLRIHPAQYALVGLAMAMFYMLLVSFAEIIGFAYAYLAASGACVALLAYYLSFVLNSKIHAFTFAVFLTALYGALYGILASEDNALVMGSLLVFGLLAVTMVITRKVDWYALGMQDNPLS